MEECQQSYSPGDQWLDRIHSSPPLAQVEALAEQVGALKFKDSVGYAKRNVSKLLAAIAKLAFEVIPQDPSRLRYSLPRIRLAIAFCPVGPKDTRPRRVAKMTASRAAMEWSRLR